MQLLKQILPCIDPMAPSLFEEGEVSLADPVSCCSSAAELAHTGKQRNKHYIAQMLTNNQFQCNSNLFQSTAQCFIILHSYMYMIILCCCGTLGNKGTKHVYTHRHRDVYLYLFMHKVSIRTCSFFNDLRKYKDITHITKIFKLWPKCLKRT